MSEIKTYCGDCLQLMQNIQDKSVDFILCDLPYGITQNKWDTCIDLDLLWAEYKRIIKKGGAIALFGQLPFSAKLICSNIKQFRYEWIWQKKSPTGFLNAHKYPLRIHESILIFCGSVHKYNPQFTWSKPYRTAHGTKSANYGSDAGCITVSDGRRYPTDILIFGKDKEKLHPTQKPIALLEYLIKTYTDEGETVLDNCMGVGSTAIACMNTNRNFIGIELDKDYFETAQRRIKERETVKIES